MTFSLQWNVYINIFEQHSLASYLSLFAHAITMLKSWSEQTSGYVMLLVLP